MAPTDHHLQRPPHPVHGNAHGQRPHAVQSSGHGQKPHGSQSNPAHRRGSQFGSIYIAPEDAIHSTDSGAETLAPGPPKPSDAAPTASEDAQDEMVAHRATVKAKTLAEDILDFEERMGFLEKRNEWLTGKLLEARRSFIESTLSGNTGALVDKTFRAWRDNLKEISMARRLEEALINLTEMQEMGEALSTALEREQKLREKAESALRQADDEVRRLTTENEALKKQQRVDEKKLLIMERQKSIAESALYQSQKCSRTVMEAVGEYHHLRDDLEEQHKTDTFEKNMFEEAKETKQKTRRVLDKMNSVLEHVEDSSGFANRSRERARQKKPSTELDGYISDDYGAQTLPLSVPPNVAIPASRTAYRIERPLSPAPQTFQQVVPNGFGLHHTFSGVDLVVPENVTARPPLSTQYSYQPMQYRSAMPTSSPATMSIPSRDPSPMPGGYASPMPGAYAYRQGPSSYQPPEQRQVRIAF